MKNAYYYLFYNFYLMGFRVWKDITWLSVTITLSLVLCFHILTILIFLSIFNIIDYTTVSRFQILFLYFLIWFTNIVIFGYRKNYMKIIEKFSNKYPRDTQPYILISLLYYFLSFFILFVMLFIKEQV
jgi:hypothetical protein